MKIFVSAAEISSDLQAEKILVELIKLYPDQKIEIAGIGGPRLRAIPGFQAVESAENLRVMGFTEVVGKIFSIRAILQKTVRFLKDYQPDLLITFDYPDFHFSLLRRIANLNELKKTIKICGIPPKVWVWRTKRIHEIKRLYDAVWVIFPFEEKLYRSHGIPVIYAGNPLISDILKKTSLVKKEPLQVEGSLRLAVFPGSREAELKYHLPLIPLILERVSKETRKVIKAEVPIPRGISVERLKRELQNTASFSFDFFEDGSAEVLARNSLGLIKSGTSSLEAAVLGCVPVIYYKVSPTTEWLFRSFVRYLGPIGLPNILLGIKNRTDLVFPEFIGSEASVDSISSKLITLIQNPDQLKALQAQGNILKEQLASSESVPAAVASRIQKWVLKPIGKRIKRPSSVLIGIASFLWSCINRTRRFFYEVGLLKTTVISVKSVLVGNLQAGGAGKTPIVIAIAKAAVARGFKVGVISRGYGGQRNEKHLIVDPAGENSDLKLNAAVIGDEPVEILNEVPEVTLGLSSDRASMAKKLEKKGINFLIFDDGFQNLKFKAHSTVLALTDAQRDEVVYRDFASEAKSADLLLFSKGYENSLTTNAVPIEWEVESLPQKPIWLVCGVGDPNEVAQFYENEGVKVVRTLTKPDHASWSSEELLQLEKEAIKSGAILAITPKDATKIDTVKFPAIFILKRKIKNLDWLERLFTL